MTSAPRPAVTPRYGRIAAFAGAVLSTLVTVSAGAGLLPAGGAAAQAAPEPDDGGAMSLAAGDVADDLVSDSASAADGATYAPTGPATEGANEGATDSATDSATDESLHDPSTLLSGSGTAAQLAAGAAGDTSATPPADSGQGRRVVFDMGDQRVWLIGGDEEVRRSYLVSGSISDNLGPGTYEVYSRSRHATGIDGSSMDYMVRFTTGDNAAIGFHDIPEMDGEPVQTAEQLGTPLSHGCVRQDRPDAVALWKFAPVGTTVVVTP